MVGCYGLVVVVCVLHWLSLVTSVPDRFCGLVRRHLRADRIIKQSKKLYVTRPLVRAARGIQGICYIPAPCFGFHFALGDVFLGARVPM